MTSYIEGKTCIVTGATSGIGYELALALAKMGGRVIGIGRDPGRCERARVAITTAADNDDVKFHIADLSSLAATRRAAAEISANRESASVLVHNAGGYSSRRRVGPEGLEYQFALNYLAGFHLTALLYPVLLKAGGAKVIMVGSGSHYAGRMRWNDLQFERGYFGLSAYDQSKLALALFVRELGRRVPPEAKITACAADPGLVRTGIGFKGTDLLTRLVWKLRSRSGITPEESAAGIAALAEAPGLPSGEYWVGAKAVPPSRRACGAEDARRLWEVSEKLCGIDFSIS